MYSMQKTGRSESNASKSKTMVVGVTSGSERWRINGEEMEEVKAFKYLGDMVAWWEDSK